MKSNQAMILWDMARTSDSRWILTFTQKICSWRVSPKHLQFSQDFHDSRKYPWPQRSLSTPSGASSPALEAERIVMESPSMRRILLSWSTLAQISTFQTIEFLTETILVMKWRYQRSTSRQKVKPNFLLEKLPVTSFAKTLIKQFWTKMFGLFNSLPTNHRQNQSSNPNLSPQISSLMRLGNSLLIGAVLA